MAGAYSSAYSSAYDVGAGGGPTYTLDAAAGSFSLTGQSAGLAAARKLAVTTGEFTLAGTTTGLAASRNLAVTAGSFALAGNDAGLTTARKLAASVGSFSLTGNAADLVYTPTGGPTYTLAANTGSFSLTGQAAGLAVERKLAVAVGAFNLAGQDIGLAAGRKIAAEPGQFTLTGQTANVLVSRKLLASAGSFSLTGPAVTLTYSGSTLPPITNANTMFGVAGYWIDEVVTRIEDTLKAVTPKLVAADLIFTYDGDTANLEKYPDSDRFIVVCPVEAIVNQSILAGAGAPHTVSDSLFAVDVYKRVGQERDRRSDRKFKHTSGLTPFVREVINALQVQPLFVFDPDDDYYKTPLVHPMRLVRYQWNPRRPQSGWGWCRTTWAVKFRTDFDGFTE